MLPRDPAGRARAIGWVFAALNSIEPFLGTLTLLRIFAEAKPWQEEAKAAVRPLAVMRLAQLATALGYRDWLEDRFTIGDLLMVDVLRNVPEPDLLAAHPNLAAYVERGTARPAFKAALTAQMAVFQQPRR